MQQTNTNAEPEHKFGVANMKEGLIADQNNEHEVEVTTQDNQIYQSAQTFESLNLSETLLKGIYGMGFQKPSKIQAAALPMILAEPPTNLIAQSQSGTGKTAAFVLAMLSRVDVNVSETQCLCVAPSRELVRQIMDNVRELGKYTKVTTALAIPEAIDRDAPAIDAHIVIGTPGTVSSLHRKRQLNLDKVKIFVLDEADAMLDVQGLGNDSIRIRKTLPRTSQIVLFSATFTEDVRQFAAKVAPKANQIALKQMEVAVDTVKQFYMDCKNADHKYEVLGQIYGLLTIGQSIIFVHMRKTGDMLAERMISEGHEVTHIHGGFDPASRDKAIDDFRGGKSKVLITTNVLARGIDVLQVNLVVNFDVPLDGDGRPDIETYIHRIGRTGRFGRQGVSINFVHDETSYSQMMDIQKIVGKEIIRVPTEDAIVIEKILKKAVK